MIHLSKKQARQFLLMKQGLWGNHRFLGKAGIMAYIHQAGCIQYDPIDICGKNAELVLQSRVQRFSRKQLHDLLYRDRQLFDQFDKCMSICSIDDWPAFDHYRANPHRFMLQSEAVDKVLDETIEYIRNNGPICSSDLEYTHKVDWYWAPTSLSRAVLDALYFRGIAGIHTKKNTRKYYDLIERCIPGDLLNTPNPNTDEAAKHQWHVLRRLQSVGMLHNNASYAFIGIENLKTKQRNHAYKTLISQNKIRPVHVEGVKLPYYYSSTDDALMQQVVQGNLSTSNRLEFLAPLDNLIWDRKITEEIFQFSYKWEIYTPVKDRQYGYYVLPLLYQDNLIGRVELVRNKAAQQIDLKNIWLDDGYKMGKRLENRIHKKLERFSKQFI